MAVKRTFSLDGKAKTYKKTPSDGSVSTELGADVTDLVADLD